MAKRPSAEYVSDWLHSEQVVVLLRCESHFCLTSVRLCVMLIRELGQGEDW